MSRAVAVPECLFGEESYWEIDRGTLIKVGEQLHESFGIGDPVLFADAFLRTMEQLYPEWNEAS